MVILDAIVPLFGVMLIGWILRKMRVIGRSAVKTLSDYAYYVGFPILVFVSLHNIDFAALLDHKLYLVNLISIFLIAGIAYTVARALKFNDKLKAAFIVCVLFGNTAYMGLPLNKLALGEAAMPFASIIAAIYITLTFTLGLFILRHYSGVETKTKFWVLRVPLIWGVILGILFSCTGLSLPFSNLFEMIASSASPVALIAIGAFLYDAKLGGRIREITILSSLKLVLFPVTVLLISLASSFGNLAFESSLLQAAMPVAITTFILAHKFDTESDFVASAIVISTLASIVSLSVVLLFV
jgi:hypothetical protein